jgi:multisubunit Na+/H+ antiporter MnhB subunit
MKLTLYLLALALISVLFSSTEAGSYHILERSLPPVLGACLGGVLACTSIIVSVLSSSSKETKQKAKTSQKFSSFIDSLERDVKILVICLFLIVTLPYLRTLEYPVTLSIFELTPNYLKQKIFSSLEIFFASIAFLVIFELVIVLITILKKMMLIHDTDTQQDPTSKEK